MTDAIMAPISLGELFDKIGILEIKRARVQGEKKANVRRELSLLYPLADQHMRPDLKPAVDSLLEVNLALWNIEDEIREHEARGDFGKRFIELARSVYKTNDRRAELKREINIACGSVIIEEKNYG